MGGLIRHAFQCEVELDINITVISLLFVPSSKMFVKALRIGVKYPNLLQS